MRRKKKRTNNYYAYGWIVIFTIFTLAILNIVFGPF